MANNWMDERDREDGGREERDWRRTELEGRDGLRRYGEPRSFDRRDYDGDGGYEGGRDAVFGAESGDRRASRGFRTSDRGWQDPGYGGVSPQMRRGGYGGFSGRDPMSGAATSNPRAYGFGEAGFDYGYDPEILREMRRPASGGTGGYDYERGYGDGGRGETAPGAVRFERGGRGPGEFLQRAGERVANWFSGGADARTYDAREEQRHRGRGPQGYKRSDDRINDDAHERLTDDNWLDASNISVSVSGGEVTLSGTVDSREAKHRAERIVEDISGVQHVQNNLRVSRPGFLRSDSSGFGDSVAEQRMRDAETDTISPPNKKT